MGKRVITTGGLFGERHDDEPFDEVERIKIDTPVVRLFSSVRFDTDEADFYYSVDSEDSDELFDFISDLGFDMDAYDEDQETDYEVTNPDEDCKDDCNIACSSEDCLDEYDVSDYDDYEESVDLRPLGTTQKLVYKLDHFTGARFGLFVYSTKNTGGSATFSSFNYDTN